MAPTQLSAKEKANRANHARRVFKAYNEQKIKSSLKARKEISKTDQKELFERFAIMMADELYRNGLDVVINDLSLYGTVIDVQDSPLPAEGKGKAPAVPNMPVAWKLAGHLIGMKPTSGPITRQDLLYFGQGETVAHVEDLLDDSLSATDSADSDDGNGDGSSGAGSSGAGSSSAGSSSAGSSSAGSSGAGGPSGADNLPPRPPSRKQGGPPSKRQRRASPVTQPGSTKHSTVGAQLYRGSDFGLDLNAIKAKVCEHLVEAITSKRVLPPLASAQLARFPVAVKDIQHSNRRQKLNGPGFDATPMRNLDTRYAMKTLADVIEYSTRVRDPRGTMKPDFAIHGMVTRNRDPGVTKQNRVTHGRVTKGNAPTQNYLSLGTHMMDMTKANRNRFDAEYPPNAVGKTKILKASKRQQIAEKVTREVLWQALEDVATQKPGLKIPSNRETANRYSILEDGLGKTSKKGITNREIGNAPWDTLGTVGMQEARLDRLQLTAEDAAASVVTNFIDELLDYLPLKYVRDESVEHIYSIIFGAIQNAIEPFEKPDPLALKKKLAADLIAKVLADKFGNSRAAAEEILAYFQASEGPEEYQPEFAQVYPTCGYQLTSQPVELGGPKSTKPMKTGRRKTPEPAQVRATSEVEQRFPVQEYDHIEESIRPKTFKEAVRCFELLQYIVDKNQNGQNLYGTQGRTFLKAVQDALPGEIQTAKDADELYGKRWAKDPKNVHVASYSILDMLSSKFIGIRKSLAAKIRTIEMNRDLFYLTYQIKGTVPYENQKVKDKDYFPGWNPDPLKIKTSPARRSKPAGRKMEPQAGRETQRKQPNQQATPLRHKDLPSPPNSLKRKASEPVYSGPRTRSRTGAAPFIQPANEKHVLIGEHCESEADDEKSPRGNPSRNCGVRRHKESRAPKAAERRLKREAQHKKRAKLAKAAERTPALKSRHSRPKTVHRRSQGNTGRLPDSDTMGIGEQPAVKNRDSVLKPLTAWSRAPASIDESGEDEQWDSVVSRFARRLSATAKEDPLEDNAGAWWKLW